MSVSIPTSTLEKFSTFGDLLRYLRRAAGLTQFELSVQVGYSHAQISRLEQNLRLPDIPTIEARFVPALGLETEPQVVARLLELAANVRREDAPGLGLCPYKGLNYFDEADADLFVGREALTAELTERVLSLAVTPARLRFFAVVGASGSGKSSLVRAGLVPALRWNKRSSDWQIHILTPTAHPLESLAACLTRDSTSVIATTTLIDDLLQDRRSLQVFVKRHLPPDDPLLLVIDQFEELFALCRSDEERASFIDNLLTAAAETDGPVSIVITLRADFYAHCADYIVLRDALAKNQVYIGAMNDEELRSAIEEPARRGRWELEPGLVDLLLHDVGHEPGALPLLSHALLETWQRRRSRTMTLSGYTSSGGVRGAIAQTAEAVLTDQFTSQQRSIARRIFLRLTELGDESTAADTRRRAKFDELILKAEESSLTHAVLKALADARLIITSEDTAEVAHEALIREWPTLRGWLEENREGLRLHRQMTEAAQEWNTTGRSPDLLYRGARLAQIREWASLHQDEMNELECAFLDASVELTEREAREREEQRQRELESSRRLAESERQRAEEQSRSVSQLRKRAVYLSAALVAALVMSVAALFFGRQAVVARQLATSRELAAASIASLDVDPERSVLLALEALDASHTVAAEDALHRAVQASRVKLVIAAHDVGAPVMVVSSPQGSQFFTAAWDGKVKIWDLATGEERLRLDGIAAAYAPQGERLAIVLSNLTVKMIDLATDKEIHLAGQIDATHIISFSPDGARLLTVAANIPTIWDPKTGRQLATFPGHTDLITDADFSPDGTRLVTASDDGTARVWETRTADEVLRLSDHPGWVNGARYSPDGKHIVTVSENNAYIWNAISGEQMLILAGHTNLILAAAYSPDGTRIATGGLDRKIIVWDALTGKELFRLAGHTGDVTGLAFSPQGDQLLSSSTDGTARRWDVGPDREFLTIAAPGTSGQLAFGKDGESLATINAAGGIEIRDVRSGEDKTAFPAPDGGINDMVFDPAGGRMFIAGEDGQVVVQNSLTGAQLAVISAHTGEISAMAISNDGRYLATGGQDYKVHLWEIASGKLPDRALLTLQTSSIVYSVVFDAGGQMLAVGGQEGHTILWDIATGKEILVLRGHADIVTGIDFRPDGKHIATASLDDTTKIWDLATGQELMTLGSHTGPVTSVAYSPDGTRIATASEDGTSKLWNAVSGEELLTFSGDGSALYEAKFSPDGKLLATGGEGGVRVYLLRIEDLIALAEARVTRSLTVQECQKYLHRSQATCAPVSAIPTATSLPPTDQGRVCQVTNTAGLYDASFNEVLYKGLLDSKTTFGWDARVLQSASQQDFARNIQEFLRSDCDLIVGVFPMSDVLRDAAESSPQQKFYIEFLYEEPLENVWMQLYASDQSAFLAGYLAASMTKTDRVGVFGGLPIPQVTVFMDGFALGVDHYNKQKGTNVTLLGWDMKTQTGLFAGGFCCAAEGRETTRQLLEQQADVIFPVAGPDIGAGALYAVKTYGSAYIIGVDTDWALTNPEYADIVLTSVVKNYDASVIQAVTSIVEENFTGGVHIGTLKTGEVGLAPFYRFDDIIPPEVKADLEQIQKGIAEGKIQTRPE